MMVWDGELEPIALQQLHRGAKGNMIEVDADVLNVVKDIKQIDTTLHVRWSQAGEYFVIYCREPHDPPGRGYSVLHTPILDQRVVELLQKAAWEQRQEGYSLADVLDKKDKEADKAQEYKFSQQIGERAEQLAYALRHDLGKMDTSRAVITKDIPKEKK